MTAAIPDGEAVSSGGKALSAADQIEITARVRVQPLRSDSPLWPRDLNVVLPIDVERNQHREDKRLAGELGER